MENSKVNNKSLREIKARRKGNPGISMEMFFGKEQIKKFHKAMKEDAIAKGYINPEK